MPHHFTYLCILTDVAAWVATCPTRMFPDESLTHLRFVLSTNKLFYPILLILTGS